jgi:hypothetical protein
MRALCLPRQAACNDRPPRHSVTDGLDCCLAAPLQVTFLDNHDLPRWLSINPNTALFV